MIMADDAIFSAEDFAEGQASPVLGPAYFSTRRYVDKFMEGTEPDVFRPMVDKLVDNIRGQLWDDVEAFLLCDTESNLQGQMWRTVDATVQALLTGEKWAIERYAVGDRYDAKAVREAVTRQAPPELWDERVTELRAELAILRERQEQERALRSELLAAARHARSVLQGAIDAIPDVPSFHEAKEALTAALTKAGVAL